MWGGNTEKEKKPVKHEETCLFTIHTVTQYNNITVNIYWHTSYAQQEKNDYVVL